MGGLSLSPDHEQGYINEASSNGSVMIYFTVDQLWYPANSILLESPPAVPTPNVRSVFLESVHV